MEEGERIPNKQGLQQKMAKLSSMIKEHELRLGAMRGLLRKDTHPTSQLPSKPFNKITNNVGRAPASYLNPSQSSDKCPSYSKLKTMRSIKTVILSSSDSQAKNQIPDQVKVNSRTDSLPKSANESSTIQENHTKNIYINPNFKNAQKSIHLNQTLLDSKKLSTGSDGKETHNENSLKEYNKLKTGIHVNPNFKRGNSKHLLNPKISGNSLGTLIENQTLKVVHTTEKTKPCLPNISSLSYSIMNSSRKESLPKEKSRTLYVNPKLLQNNEYESKNYIYPQQKVGDEKIIVRESTSDLVEPISFSSIQNDAGDKNTSIYQMKLHSANINTELTKNGGKVEFQQIEPPNQGKNEQPSSSSDHSDVTRERTIESVKNCDNIELSNKQLIQNQKEFLNDINVGSEENFLKVESEKTMKSPVDNSSTMFNVKSNESSVPRESSLKIHVNRNFKRHVPISHKNINLHRHMPKSLLSNKLTKLISNNVLVDRNNISSIVKRQVINKGILQHSMPVKQQNNKMSRVRNYKWSSTSAINNRNMSAGNFNRYKFSKIQPKALTCHVADSLTIHSPFSKTPSLEHTNSNSKDGSLQKQNMFTLNCDHSVPSTSKSSLVAVSCTNVIRKHKASPKILQNKIGLPVSKIINSSNYKMSVLNHNKVIRGSNSPSNSITTKADLLKTKYKTLRNLNVMNRRTIMERMNSRNHQLCSQRIRLKQANNYHTRLKFIAERRKLLNSKGFSPNSPRQVSLNRNNIVRGGQCNTKTTFSRSQNVYPKRSTEMIHTRFRADYSGNMVTSAPKSLQNPSTSRTPLIAISRTKVIRKSKISPKPSQNANSFKFIANRNSPKLIRQRTNSHSNSITIKADLLKAKYKTLRNLNVTNRCSIMERMNSRNQQLYNQSIRLKQENNYTRFKFIAERRKLLNSKAFLQNTPRLVSLSSNKLVCEGQSNTKNAFSRLKNVYPLSQYASKNGRSVNKYNHSSQLAVCRNRYSLIRDRLRLRRQSKFNSFIQNAYVLKAKYRNFNATNRRQLLACRNFKKPHLRGQTDGFKHTTRKRLKSVTIGGIKYHSSRMKLQRKLSINDMKVNQKQIIRVRGEKFEVGNGGRTLKRVGDGPARLNKVYLGGVTFIRSKENDSTMQRTNTHNIRLLLRQAKQRSIAQLTKKMRKNNEPCPIFHRFGKCSGKEKGTCNRVHDRKHVAVCKKFLRGDCDKKNCLLSHDVGLTKMPTCRHYLAGVCVRENCPYLHVKLNNSTPICLEFLKGYCPHAEKCKNRHIEICPEYEESSKCSKGKCCPYPHPKNYHRTNAICLQTTKKRDLESTSDSVEKSELIDVPKKNKPDARSRYYMACADGNEMVEVNSTPAEETTTDKADDDDDDDNTRSWLKSRPKLGQLAGFIPLN